MEEFKADKVRLAMMLCDSDNQGVRQANVTVKRAEVEGALREAEERLQHADIMGTLTQGRLGLGVIIRAS